MSNKLKQYLYIEHNLQLTDKMVSDILQVVLEESEEVRALKESNVALKLCMKKLKSYNSLKAVSDQISTNNNILTKYEKK